MRIALQLAGALLLLAVTGVCADQKNKPEHAPKPAAKMPAPPRNPGKAPGGAPKGNGEKGYKLKSIKTKK